MLRLGTPMLWLNKRTLICCYTDGVCSITAQFYKEHLEGKKVKADLRWNSGCAALWIAASARKKCLCLNVQSWNIFSISYKFLKSHERHCSKPKRSLNTELISYSLGFPIEFITYGMNLVLLCRENHHYCNKVTIVLSNSVRPNK